ncbi:hypothetical protein CANCADRAFT_18276, partial [Tortispora caseinolytica NRRL Y-17796]
MTMNVGARCLAYHGPLLYEAKILRVHDPEVESTMELAKKQGNEDIMEEDIDKLQYFVHYKGWKSSWDEWVLESRVVEWSEESLRLQKELRQAALAAQNASKAALESKKRKPEEETNGSSTRKARRGTEPISDEIDRTSKVEVSLVIPDPLKRYLVDDWERVTKNHQLVSLPRKPSVSEILSQYKKSRGSKLGEGSSKMEILEEVVSGLALYFDRALGNMLLYKFERQQYLEIRKKYAEFIASDVYGAEHLLRLFVSLPELIAQTNMDAQSVSVLSEHLHDVLAFLAQNQSSFFLTEYENASPSYESLA